jgi:hypothetical protein
MGGGAFGQLIFISFKFKELQYSQLFWHIDCTKKSHEAKILFLFIGEPMKTIFSKYLLTAFVIVFIGALWFKPSMAGNVKMMSKEELKTRLGNPDTLILDVRADSHWASSDQKIKGTLRVDPDNFNSWAGIFPPSRTIVFYCA